LIGGGYTELLFSFFSGGGYTELLFLFFIGGGDTELLYLFFIGPAATRSSSAAAHIFGIDAPRAGPPERPQTHISRCVFFGGGFFPFHGGFSHRRRLRRSLVPLPKTQKGAHETQACGRENASSRRLSSAFRPPWDRVRGCGQLSTVRAERVPDAFWFSSEKTQCKNNATRIRNAPRAAAERPQNAFVAAFFFSAGVFILKTPCNHFLRKKWLQGVRVVSE